jgi:hypothetical protein
MPPTQIDPVKLAAWLDERWAGPKACPVCRQNDWQIGDSLLELKRYGTSTSEPVIPLVSLTCNHCAHTLLFNARVAQVFGLDAAVRALAEALASPASKNEADERMREALRKIFGSQTQQGPTPATAESYRDALLRALSAPSTEK